MSNGKTGPQKAAAEMTRVAERNPSLAAAIAGLLWRCREGRDAAAGAKVVRSLAAVMPPDDVRLLADIIHDPEALHVVGDPRHEAMTLARDHLSAERKRLAVEIESGPETGMTSIPDFQAVDDARTLAVGRAMLNGLEIDAESAGAFFWAERSHLAAIKAEANALLARRLIDDDDEGEGAVERAVEAQPDPLAGLIPTKAPKGGGGGEL